MSQQRQQPGPEGNEQNSGYGYGGYGGYGNYYYGYGYGYTPQGGSGSDASPTRGFRDYLMILRERVWYLIVTFFIVFTGTLLYTIKTTPVYEAGATVQVLRREVRVLNTPELDKTNEVLSQEDLNTQIKIVESIAIVNAVAQRIKDQDLKRFMAPYEDALTFGGPMTPLEVLVRNRRVVPMRLSLMIGIYYYHPDPEMAAQVANLFADEFIQYNLRLSIENAMKAVEDLRIRADQQRKKVEELEGQLADYREKYNTVSLENKADIDHKELSGLNEIVVTSKRMLDEAETRWNLVQTYQSEGKPLENLSFIAQSARVSELAHQVAVENIKVASMGKRYKEKHPRLMEATRAKQQAEAELKIALEEGVRKTYSDYQASKQNYDQATKRLAQKEREVIDLSKLAVEYNSIQREFEVNHTLYQSMVMAMNTHMAEVNLKSANARVVDRAFPPDRAARPNVPVNLLVGFFGGIACGIGLVFIVALMDDRIKSAFDVEAIVGLPLLGVIPRIKRLNSPEKAQAVAANCDRRVTEAFRSIYSALRINDASKNARVFLMTSTVPSEGKSFLTTNLALTYAVHGDRVLVLDADLRMPNVAKSLSLPEDIGITNHFQDGVPLDSCIQKNVYPNLDVLPVGPRAKNPTRVLNSTAFADLLRDLRTQYDRVFVDSPPIGAVSDALNLLPHVDGVIYCIKFNTVKKKVAKGNLRRLIEANVPIFGAVLNQISISVASHYYTNYYDRSYKNYYQEGEDEPLSEKPQEPAPTR